MQAGLSRGLHLSQSGLGRNQGRSARQIRAVARLTLKNVDLSRATPNQGPVMSFTNRISQTLHDEHRATVALMERLEQLLARGRRSVPDKADSNVARLLSDLSTGVE